MCVFTKILKNTIGFLFPDVHYLSIQEVRVTNRNLESSHTGLASSITHSLGFTTTYLSRQLVNTFVCQWKLQDSCILLFI